MTFLSGSIKPQMGGSIRVQIDTGYQGELIQMYVPLFFVSGMCFLMAIHGIVSGIIQRRAAKKLADSNKVSRG